MRAHWLPRSFIRVRQVRLEYGSADTTAFWSGGWVTGFAIPITGAHSYTTSRVSPVNPVNLVWWNLFRQILERAIAVPRAAAARVRRCLLMISIRQARRAKRRGFIQSLRVA